jgi:hypothetical protein
MTALIDARDQMFEIVRTAWVGAGLDVTKMAWPDKPFTMPDPQDAAPWCRVNILHADAGQQTLANHAGRRRWGRTGTLTAQCFTRIARGVDYGPAQAVRFALEGASTQNCVWFRNVRLVEVGEDGAWFNVNVTAIFEYSEVH